MFAVSFSMIATLEPAQRAVLSLTVLVVLLAWETTAPFFPFFVREPRGRGPHGLRNVFLGLVNALVTGTLFVLLWRHVADWTAVHAFGVLHWCGLSGWSRVAAAILLFDGWMYVWHRLSHGVPWLWKFHRTHHTDFQMDVTTANRFHLGEIIASSLLRVPVIALLGISLGELALYETLMFTTVQIQHANISLGPRVDRVLRVLFVTPFIHKVHHSRVQAETDSNFSSFFSFWDRLFRTFRLRDDPQTIQFGLAEFDAPRHHTLGGLFGTPRVQSKSAAPPLASGK